MKRKVCCVGLGGGLDIVNASLPYFACKRDSHSVVLGSTRPPSQNHLSNITPFSDSGCFLTKDSVVNQKGRYIEPKIAEILDEQILFLSRQYNEKYDKKRLEEAIIKAESELGITDIIFVDGGGDSLILRNGDASSYSETSDPFSGGDAETMSAIYSVNCKSPIYQAIISVGLDIDESAFQKNVDLLKERGAYYGRVNLKTGKKEDYLLDNLLSFQTGFLEDFFQLAEKVLVLKEEDMKIKGKMKSHTATVTYHALKGNYGLRRTYVPWEPVKNGVKGVEVKEEHCWMYFFLAKEIEKLKRDLNNK